MADKQWNFKIPGNPDVKEVIVTTNEITTVYDLLDMLRKEECKTLRKNKDGSLKPQPRTAVNPIISGILEKRRYPSA